MKTYIDFLSIFTALSVKDPRVKNIHTKCTMHSTYGACIVYSFDTVGNNFYEIVSVRYMLTNFPCETFYEMDGYYNQYKLDDGSLITIPQIVDYGAWITIPIKKI